MLLFNSHIQKPATANVDVEQERQRINAPVDFSITSYVAVVNTVQELSTDEKIDSFDVFKDPQNREIFMAAEPATHLLWLKKKLVSYQHSFSLLMTYFLPPYPEMWTKKLSLISAV